VTAGQGTSSSGAPLRRTLRTWVATNVSSPHRDSPLAAAEEAAEAPVHEEGDATPSMQTGGPQPTKEAGKRQSLLAKADVRSDACTATCSSDASSSVDLPAPQPLPPPSFAWTICLESLVPVRGHVFDVQPTQTVADLKALYIARTVSDARLAPRTSLRPDPDCEQRLRVIFDGAELEDECTLAESGVFNGARLCVLSLRVRRGAGWQLFQLLYRWLPVWAALLLGGVVYYQVIRVVASPSTSWGQGCSKTALTVFIAIGILLVLPYAIVLSGLFQDDRGRRLMWFLRLHVTAALTSAAIALAALSWFIAGSVWLFGDFPGCSVEAPALFYSSLLLWLLLFAANFPWMVLLAMPFLLLCRSPIALRIIARLSGAGGGAMQH